VEVRGMEHFYAAGDKVLIVANHQSFLDPFLLAVLIPEKPAFAMNVYQADKWYFRWIERIIKLYKLDPSKPMTMKTLIGDVKKGAKVVVFPEGRITTTSGIMKVYAGTKLILNKADAKVLPVFIEGAQYSKLSKIGKKVKQRWFPKITLTVQPPKSAAEAQNIYDVLTESAFASSPYRRPMLEALLEARDTHGGRHVIASDITRMEMNYRQLFTRAFILSDKLSQPLSNGNAVGVLLPNALGGLVTFVALHMLGKLPCMLNFSAGEGNIKHACHIAQVKTILTSRVFVEKGKFEALIAALEKDHKIFYLEDIRPSVTLGDKLGALLKALAPRQHLQGVLSRIKPDDPAVVLYTSGSEGTPKGVALSHANILANVYQACSRLDLNASDIVFNALPIFHSFGLTIGMLMPPLRGIQTFLYPSPLHYRVIPELIYDTNATIMLGTDTFFNGYARYAHDYDFNSVRLAVAGAEKLREATRRTWADRFNVNIMQGYGVTETSPALSFNTLIEHRAGTVGRPFPAIQTKLEPVPGLEKGGRLFVKGPNVMLGYLKADQPGVIQPQGEWYDTGDIVDIDEQGFITILGRAKRFAKIGGEMVSLLAVEELALAVENVCHAAVAVADPRKGEQVILYTESKTLAREQLQAEARNRGVPELFLPRQVIYMEAIPRLGNGKIDYPALQSTANSPA
jgi:acyl-[acyl-carrier-protein]-phospholipid O-acyltransferase / long-chain-fatty-acid--[acyl-carrier-protein] ligase